MAEESIQLPAMSFLYPDMESAFVPSAKDAGKPESKVARAGENEQNGPSPQEINDLLSRARIEAVTETERRLRSEYDARLEAEAAKIKRTLEMFREERKDYFSRVESDVVHLALSIAAKILHREAQVDPMLVAALVRIAVEKLHDGSSVSVRVSPVKADKWRERLANPLNGSSFSIIEDPSLGPDDCILETDLGSANFSIEAQLKEVEQGFFDLLAQRPQIK
jgi:flagellar assembly protein FliH